MKMLTSLRQTISGAQLRCAAVVTQMRAIPPTLPKQRLETSKGLR